MTPPAAPAAPAAPVGSPSNHRLLLLRRPAGLVQAEDFEADEVAVPEPAADEALMRVEWLGIDATVRTWLNAGEGYLPPVGIGDVVRCSGIGRVIASNLERFPVGTVLSGLPGWQEYATFRDDGLATPLPGDVDPRALLAVFGATGLTAYIGMLDIAAIREGETVVVSAAAGATGSLAAQIAKLHGCRVVGIVGSDEKCAWLVDELGLDGAINYRADDVKARLKELCPDRIDVYFDNVGGPILDAVLGGIALRGRVVLCGAISIYNESRRPPGPANYVNLIQRRGRMEGFLSLDYWDRIDEVNAKLGEWVASGQLHYRTHVFEGLSRAPEALNAMFTGDNIGKIVIRL